MSQQFTTTLVVRGDADQIEAFRRRHIAFVEVPGQKTRKPEFRFESVLTPPSCLKLPRVPLNEAKTLKLTETRTMSDVLFVAALAPAEMAEIFNAHLTAMIRLDVEHPDRKFAEMMFRAKYLPFVSDPGKQLRRAYTGGKDALLDKLREILPEYMSILDRAAENFDKYGVLNDLAWKESRWGVVRSSGTTEFKRESFRNGNGTLKVTFVTAGAIPVGILTAVQRQWQEQLTGHWSSVSPGSKPIHGAFAPQDRRAAA